MAGGDYFLFGGFGKPQDRVSTLVKDFSRGGQGDAAAASFKQGYAQFFLQPFHLVTDIGLCHGDAAGSGIHAPGIRNGTE